MKLLFNIKDICIGMEAQKYHLLLTITHGMFLITNKIKPSFPVSDIELDLPIDFNPIGHAKKHLIGEFKENNMKLFVDSKRCPEGYTQVTNLLDFMNIYGLKFGQIESISVAYNLGEGELTGDSILRYIIMSIKTHKIIPPRITCHVRNETLINHIKEIQKLTCDYYEPFEQK